MWNLLGSNNPNLPSYNKILYRYKRKLFFNESKKFIAKTTQYCHEPRRQINAQPYETQDIVFFSRLNSK